MNHLQLSRSLIMVLSIITSKFWQISATQMPYNTAKWPQIQYRLGDLENHLRTNSPTYAISYAIKKFNPATENYNYDSLYLVEQDPAWKSKMRELLPKMARIALRLPELLPNPGLKTLRQGENGVVTLNQLQVLSLLANSFFCTYPAKEDSFPRNKFCTLFKGGYEQSKAEKIKSILHYFDKMLERFPPNTQNLGTKITFERRSLGNNEIPAWGTSTTILTPVEVVKQGYIEDSQGFGHLQVDFANKFIGGGILGNGATQEEVRFAMCPELIASVLIFEELRDNEAAIITGAWRFSRYSGYASTFTYDGDYKDDTTLDGQGRRDTSIVAIDALKFKDGKTYEQFWAPQVDRELKKAFAGYSRTGRLEDAKPIATGNWGAGVFNGNQDLKFLIQWMAISQSEKRMKLFTVGRRGQDTHILSILNHMKKAITPVTVGKLYAAIKLYKTKVVDKHQQDNLSIFQFIKTDADCQRVLGI